MRISEATRESQTTCSYTDRYPNPTATFAVANESSVFGELPIVTTAM
jgi:hypothetical protein